VIVNAKAMHRLVRTAPLLAVIAAGCGQYVRDSGRAPAQPVIMSLEAASGAEPQKFGGTLASDVITNVKRTVNGQEVDVPTIFGDSAQVKMTLILKDPGQAGVTTAPSLLNQVTFTRYHVAYHRADGRNAPGVDVPFAFDGAATFTVGADSAVTAGFEIVRNAAKEEAPLMALRASGVIITTIADVTFYGRDQAGNEVSSTGSIQIDFGNFGDPQ
jgi:hypothetical protein